MIVYAEYDLEEIHIPLKKKKGGPLTGSLPNGGVVTCSKQPGIM